MASPLRRLSLPALLLAAALPAALAGSAAPPARVVDTDDGVEVPTPSTNPASRSYSPYAGRPSSTRVYFGDTHLHTANSGDAFMAGDRLGPEQAYRLARGEEVVSSTGVPVRLSRPLDFLVITDHAEGLGLMTEVAAGNPSFKGDPQRRCWRS